VIIDEMQDSKGGQLTIIQGLSRSAICLAAADDYQDLDGDEVNIAVNWARDYAEVITLKHNHRTTATGLLEAANALREGRFIPPRGKGFVVLGARNHNAGAGFVSRNLTWWRHCTDIAIITPVRPENSNFVQNLISRVEQGPIGERQYGPYQLPWEVSPDDEQTEFLAKLNLPDDSSATVRASDILLPDNSSLSLGITAWLDNQRRIRGQTMFSVDEIKHQIQSIQQRTRTYRRVRSQGVRAMTIHQAKNREFDSVIVLWPYEVQGSPERLRRLLYNAITRAKRQALVVVQNPNRLNQAPFI
jgi:superfamily I DNA/RNA helicase